MKPRAVGAPLAWVCEDTLPSEYPYDAMFGYSEVRDGVRMFPVFGPDVMYAEKCCNHGIAMGMRAGQILFNDETVLDMAMLIRRLAHTLEPHTELRRQAIEFLNARGLSGSPLRENTL